MSSICGGVISESENRKAMEKDIWANAMGYVMPDKQYEKYVAFLKAGKNKEATKVFEKYARSQI